MELGGGMYILLDGRLGSGITDGARSCCVSYMEICSAILLSYKSTQDTTKISEFNNDALALELVDYKLDQQFPSYLYF